MQPFVNYSRNYVFYAISQKPDKKFGEKAGDQVCFDGIDQFCKYMLFLHVLHLLLLGKTP